MVKGLRNIFLLLVFLSLFGSGIAYADQDFLTTSEREWLLEHPVIRISPDPDAAPIEWIDSKGQYRGMSADYLNIIAKKLGVTFQVIPAKSWTAVLQLAKNRQIDLVPAAAVSPQRNEYISFTASYLNVPGVLISSHNYKSVKELLGKRVAVVADYVWDDFITKHDVDVVLVRTEDTRTALDLVAMGAVDAMVSDLATATEGIQKNGITNLRIVNYLNKKLELSVGVRKDWPELTTILNKTLATITPAQRDEITQRWFSIVDIPWWRNPLVRTIALAVVTVFMLLIVAIVA